MRVFLSATELNDNAAEKVRPYKMQRGIKDVLAYTIFHFVSLQPRIAKLDYI